MLCLETASPIGAAKPGLVRILHSAHLKQATGGVALPGQARRVRGTRHVAGQGEDGRNDRRRLTGTANLKPATITIGVVDIDARIGIGISRNIGDRTIATARHTRRLPGWPTDIAATASTRSTPGRLRAVRVEGRSTYPAGIGTDRRVRYPRTIIAGAGGDRYIVMLIVAAA